LSPPTVHSRQNINQGLNKAPLNYKSVDINFNTASKSPNTTPSAHKDAYSQKLTASSNRKELSTRDKSMRMSNTSNISEIGKQMMQSQSKLE